jgi:hypothetical protein
MEELNKYVADNVSYIIVGTKNDLDDKREVSVKEGIEKANRYNCKFFETSSK